MEGYWTKGTGNLRPDEGTTSYLQENLLLMKRDAAISQVKDVVKVSVLALL